MRRTRRRDRESSATSHRRGSTATGRVRDRDGSSGSRRTSPVERVHRSAGNQAVQRQTDDDSRGLQPIEDADEYDIDVSREVMATVVASFLQERGISPPADSGLELADYVSTTAWQSGGSYSNTTASVRVGHDGTLLPSAEYLDEHRPEGGYAESSLEPATHLLQFQVDPIGDGSALVLSRFTRVESSVIEKQEDAWTDDSLQGYLSGLDETLETSGIELGDPGTGRVPPDERQYRDQSGDPAGDVTTGAATGAAAGTGRSAGRENESGPTSPDKEPTGTPAGPATGGGGARDREYEVREGDTLWDIAEREYGDPRLWAAIYESPENDIADPDLIHPGETLILPTQREAEAFDLQGYAPPPSLGVGEGTF